MSKLKLLVIAILHSLKLHILATYLRHGLFEEMQGVFPAEADHFALRNLIQAVMGEDGEALKDVLPFVVYNHRLCGGLRQKQIDHLLM